MLQLCDPFNDKVADGDGDHDRVGNGGEEDNLTCIACLHSLLNLIGEWIRRRPCLEFELRVVCRHPQYRFVHEGGEQSHRRRRCQVDIADELVGLINLVRLINLV